MSGVLKPKAVDWGSLLRYANHANWRRTERTERTKGMLEASQVARSKASSFLDKGFQISRERGCPGTAAIGRFEFQLVRVEGLARQP